MYSMGLSKWAQFTSVAKILMGLPPDGNSENLSSAFENSFSGKARLTLAPRNPSPTDASEALRRKSRRLRLQEFTLRVFVDFTIFSSKLKVTTPAGKAAPLRGYRVETDCRHGRAGLVA